MEALIKQDFEFNMLSKAYAEFLIECHNGYPDGRVERVPAGLYLNKDANTINVYFDSPSDIAMFLKLKFGAHLRTRPVPPPMPDKEDIMKQLKNITFQKTRQIKKNYEYYNWDYEKELSWLDKSLIDTEMKKLDDEYRKMKIYKDQI